MHVSLNKLSSEDKARHLENIFNVFESVLSVSKDCVILGDGAGPIKEVEIKKK